MDYNLMDNCTANLTNATADSLPTTITANWGWLPVTSITMLITGFILNMVVLLRFLTDASLISPFNLLIANLLLANLSYFVIWGPLDFINNLYTVWWLGETWCSVYMYGIWVVSLVQMSSHPLIAINRLWAISFPMSYRRLHNNWFILLLCCGAWLLAHLIALPIVVVDAKYYRLPVETGGCTLNMEVPSQNAYAIGIECVCCLLELIVVLAFPVTAYRVKTRKKVGTGVAKTNRSTKFVGNATFRGATSYGITGNKGRDFSIEIREFFPHMVFSCAVVELGGEEKIIWCAARFRRKTPW